MPARPAERRLRAVPPAPPVDPDAAARAWGIVADGFEEALGVDGVDEGDRARFAHCWRQARKLAGLPPLTDGAGAA